MSERAAEFVREEDGQHLHWCPGCESLHVIPTKRGGWSFDGDYVSPSFAPSVKHTWYPDDVMRGRAKVCHYFIQAGRINFCPDCTHDLAGQVVPMVDIGEALAERDRRGGG